MKLIERIEQLAKIGPRVTGSPEEAIGKSMVINWMLEDGLTVETDEFNNIIGRTRAEGKRVVTGSHLDTVATAGKYDGVLGVLAGLEAARLNPELPIEVVVFHDEENTMSGSIGYCSKKPDIQAFLELHVEQGPVLDVQGFDIGAVTGIVGQRRCSFTVTGQENHAGTTPMNMRDDALYKASTMVVYVSDLAEEMYDSLVATVGQLDVSPNAFSVIPGRVDLTLQVRDIYVNTMEEFVKNIAETFDLRYKIMHSSEPTMCDTDIITTIADVSHSLGLKSIMMPSRASHDAQNFTWCPMGMIFVPSIGGISHSPLEETTSEMCMNGTKVLTETIKRIHYAQ